MKKKIMSWEDLGKEMEQVWSMSCKPGPEFKSYKSGSVIDEEQSVRWNREQVEFQNNQYQEEVKRLNQLKNDKVKEVSEQIYNKIMDGTPGLSRKAAIQIWNYAYNNGHAFGWNDILCNLNEIIDIVDIAVTTLEPSKKGR